MIERKSPTDQHIIDCLNTDYGIQVAKLTLLPLGADMNASVYKAELTDKSSYFVKLKRGHHHDISITILELLKDAGIQHIIPPVKTTQGKPTQRIEDFTLIVYPFIAGLDGFNRKLTNDNWVTLGKVLRQVHDIKVSASIQDKLRREAFSSKWREIVRSLYTIIEAKPSGDEIALKLLMFMKKHMTVIRRLVDRAEELAKKISELSLTFVLCHSDIHGGNVLIDNKENIYIVDWDDPIMAPQERDLMFIGGGVANVWNQPLEIELFYKGYGKTEINMALLAYYRHERIVEDIALYGQELLLKTTGSNSRSVMFKQFIDMFEPQGVVDIAFQTDEALTLDNNSKSVNVSEPTDGKEFKLQQKR